MFDRTKKNREWYLRKIYSLRLKFTFAHAHTTNHPDIFSYIYIFSLKSNDIMIYIWSEKDNYMYNKFFIWTSNFIKRKIGGIFITITRYGKFV